MSEQEWNKIYEPHPGGWSRLSVQLNAADVERRQEVRLWAAVATFLILITGFWSLDLRQGENFELKPVAIGEVAVEGASAVQVPGTPEGVRYYWILR